MTGTLQRMDRVDVDLGFGFFKSAAEVVVSLGLSVNGTGGTADELGRLAETDAGNDQRTNDGLFAFIKNLASADCGHGSTSRWCIRLYINAISTLAEALSGFSNCFWPHAECEMLDVKNKMSEVRSEADGGQAGIRCGESGGNIEFLGEDARHCVQFRAVRICLQMGHALC